MSCHPAEIAMRTSFPWPSGVVQRVENVTANQILTITEPKIVANKP